MLHLRQKKNNPKLRYITCSYMRFFILRTPLRFGENTLKKLITKLCIIAAQDQRFARYAARRASRFPHHPSVVQKIKNMSLFVYHVLAVYDFHFRSIPFQELRSFLTLTPDTALYFHSNHTLQHPTASEYWL